MLEILACPFPATLQDTGRPGYRHLGVPLSGALDPTWLALANALAGNPPDAAAIEMRLAGPRLKERRLSTPSSIDGLRVRPNSLKGCASAKAIAALPIETPPIRSLLTMVYSAGVVRPRTSTMLIDLISV